jgi:hypothetical protein
MSSFMVSEETINRILSYFSINQYRDTWCSKRLQEIGFSIENCKAFDALGQAMLEMNREAVNQRYHEKETLKEKFTFSLSMVSSFQALKSLCCFFISALKGLCRTRHYTRPWIILRMA